MVDWSRGCYEPIADELAPVARAVVAVAAPGPGDRVLDIACGTGNAALLASARGADVIGVDAAERLLAVARDRAHAAGLIADFRAGDLLSLPVPDGSVDVAVSVFGVIFASDPALALGEVARVLDAGGRAYVSAWVPAGPILEALAAFGRGVEALTGAAPHERFAWSDSAVVAAIAAPSGLVVSTTCAELEVTAPSPAAYLDAGREHPMAVDAWPLLERAGAAAALREEMIAILAAASEDPDAMLVRSPYVVHELRPRLVSR